MRAKIGILVNVGFVLAVLYALAVNGLVTVWLDESGFGVSVNSYSNCYACNVEAE